MMSKGAKYTLIAVAAAVIAIAGLLVASEFLRYPSFYRYGRQMDLNPSAMRKHYGKPDKDKEWLFGLCLAGRDGDWDRVLELTAEDRRTQLCTYFHNLAMAEKGHLADSLMHYYQPFETGLFISVKEGAKPFMVAQSGEVWYRIGGMTMAEHSAMLSLAFSPAKNGKAFIQRLADINFINGDKQATLKYARLLGKYPEWTDDKVRIRGYVTDNDTLHLAADARAVLRLLVKANRNNTMAYEYLLCYDLLTKDIPSFVKNYDPSMPPSVLYEEAALIYLAGENAFSGENIAKFRIREETYRKFVEFTEIFENGGGMEELEKRFSHTYWFYFKFAQHNENK